LFSCDKPIGPFGITILLRRLRSASCQTTCTRFGAYLGDPNFSLRWNLIKGGFSRAVPATAPRSPSKIAKREKGIWQRRYWEHVIRSDDDLKRHINYIHFNPVKHGLVPRACDWPHSSFHRYVDRGELTSDWGGDMRDISGSFGE
jgi:putative transposase